MQLEALVNLAINDTKDSLWPAFAPELVICFTIMGMLLVRLFRTFDRIPGFLMAGIGAAVALYYAQPWVYLAGETLPAPTELFGGMLVLDSFTVFIRTVLLVFAVLFIVLTRISKFPESSDSVDFYCLVLGSMLGMCLMASANHLLMVFMAIEMASVPSYVLAGSLRYNKKSSEAALKYSIYGAGTAGIMLYGISLIAGITNTAHIPTIATQLSIMLPTMPQSEQLVLALGGLMLTVGVAFKLSAVPFHFWCPDVFEGASAEIGAFLSVASKAAALALLVRITLGMGLLPDAEVRTAAEPTSNGYFSVADSLDDAPSPSDAAIKDTDPLSGVRRFAGLVIAILAAVTCTFGNLAAYAQTNIKRLLAYSTIAHAGYMMMAVPAALAANVSSGGEGSITGEYAIAALGLYIVTYVIMNLSAFAVVAFFRNSFGSEEIADYSGLVKRSPIVVILFSLTLFSLVGLPPLAGFLGKFAIFASLAQSFKES
ncbi:NADH-quinone oxidoreductase subunit N, partial [Planctomycetota bacterium]